MSLLFFKRVELISGRATILLGVFNSAALYYILRDAPTDMIFAPDIAFLLLLPCLVFAGSYFHGARGKRWGLVLLFAGGVPMLYFLLLGIVLGTVFWFGYYVLPFVAANMAAGVSMAAAAIVFDESRRGPRDGT